MILWDRIKKNLDSGVRMITQTSSSISERTRIEMAVAKLMIEKGGIEARIERRQRRLGERVFTLWEQKNEDILKDLDVTENLMDMEEMKAQLEALRLDIRKASLGEGED